jgi:hypothetical protein
MRGDRWSSTRQYLDDRRHPSEYGRCFDFNEGRRFDGNELWFFTNKRALRVRRSGESYGHLILMVVTTVVSPAIRHYRLTLKRCRLLNLSGGRGRNRTYNLSVKSRMLCQLSYASGRAKSKAQRGFAHTLKQRANRSAFQNIAQDRARLQPPAAGLFERITASKAKAPPFILRNIDVRLMPGSFKACTLKTEPRADRAWFFYIFYFSFSSHSKSVRESHELTLLVALFLPSFSAQRS